jgi:hypothetical protein
VQSVCCLAFAAAGLQERARLGRPAYDTAEHA